jgi:hypothetical protein
MNLYKFKKLKTPLARRLNEWLPKQFINRHEYLIGHKKLFTKIRITIPKYPSDIIRKLKSINLAIQKINLLEDNYEYLMNYELRKNNYEKIYMVIFKKVKKDKDIIDEEKPIEVNDELFKKLQGYFNQSVEQAKFIIENISEKEILDTLFFLEKKYKKKEINKNLGSYTWKFFKKGYYKTVKSQFDIEKEAKKKQKEKEKQEKKLIEKLRQKFDTHYTKKIDDLINGLSETEKEKLKKDFIKDFIKKAGNFVKDAYNKKGFKSPLVYIPFHNHIANKNLPKEDTDFISYAKKQSYNLIKQKDGKYSFAK